eukprot:1149553-Pelagomonas_calceolata.AAC.6
MGALHLAAHTMGTMHSTGTMHDVYSSLPAAVLLRKRLAWEPRRSLAQALLRYEPRPGAFKI